MANIKQIIEDYLQEAAMNFGHDFNNWSGFPGSRVPTNTDSWEDIDHTDQGQGGSDDVPVDDGTDLGDWSGWGGIPVVTPKPANPDNWTDSDLDVGGPTIPDDQIPPKPPGLEGIPTYSGGGPYYDAGDNTIGPGGDIFRIPGLGGRPRKPGTRRKRR